MGTKFHWPGNSLRDLRAFFVFFVSLLFNGLLPFTESGTAGDNSGPD